MRGLTKLSRIVGAVALALGLGGAVVPSAAAAGAEMLMVPSAAMGRDIPVAFQGGGPHAVVLLDAFNAGPDVSNWVTAGNAMNTLAGSGLSVVAPAGGAYSLYTNWEANGSKQWETFLADELPSWWSFCGKRCFWIDGSGCDRTLPESDGRGEAVGRVGNSRNTDCDGHKYIT